ncbi:hypothetical protein CDCA_CDCA12G3454 [Cyanidium caldarium]|uniref:Ribosomal protein L1 n=1 Tax=Cyanidium caldarium TaxID=2771 RepID=A0AAV9IYQ7_CYACA|nr:hypothetical protein CDCA_CDCA12G3454 [Cyanidium caldarium]
MEEEEEEAVVVSLSDAVMREAISALIALEKKRYAQQCKSRKRSLWESIDAPIADANHDHTQESPPAPLPLDTISLIISLTRFPAQPNWKPRVIPLPHPLHHPRPDVDPRRCTAGAACLLVRDPTTPYRDFFLEHPPQEYRDRIRHLHIGSVLSVRDLRDRYNTYALRRQLASEYAWFMADRRIVPRLPSLLGREVFRRKKQPVPLSLEAVDGYTLPRSAPGSNVGAARSSSWERLLQQCERVRDGTTLTISGEGDCCAVRVGTTDMNIDALADNIRAVIHALQPLVPGGLRTGIASLHLKSNHSTALPLYWNSMATAVVAVARGEKEAIPQAHPPPRDGIVWVKRGCITPMMEKRQQHLRARRQRRQALRRR